ncbi:MAG TPA: 2-oxoacid:acceptor oxidoreductase family protein [Methanomassiliicoccales archaeon]|nr:2-oxoacid:acceptor oxidoreductase family protein [Methanomassiliicoccales archaeon]
MVGMKVSVRFAGMGGQGIIFAGMVLARATSLFERKDGKELFAIQTQSYGPAARGESSKCDVVISDSPTFYPFVEKPDFLVLMSQPAYDMFIWDVFPGTIVILDSEGVESRPDLTYYDIPALRRAEELEIRGAANMILLGAFVQISGVISIEAAMKAVVEMSSMGAMERNERALREGYLQGKAYQTEG